MTFRCLALSLGLLGLAVTAARSESCGFLGQDPLNLLDRQVYYEDGAGPWKLLTTPLDALASRPARLAYVFREQSRDSHSGVVVIKSARTRGLSEPQRGRAKPVALVRDAVSDCRGSKVFKGASVSAKSYDDYHDSGLGGPDVATLRNFHTAYRGRLQQCKKSNDNSADSLVPVDLRSNRGQFSFDPKVVTGGTYSQVLAWVGATTAYASSENLEDQRVEIQHYTTVANMPSCLRITLPPQRGASFLRINDLEGLTDTPPFVRANEKEWKLVP